MVFLNENLKKIIYESLLKIDSNTFYGLAPQKFIREANKLDYIVYGSAGFSKAGTSGKDLVDYFSVSVIREDFVPEEIKQKVISEMIALPGIRLADKDANVNYLCKGSTDVLIEILTITFSKARIGYIDAKY